jgi:predicted nucleotidyltransferase
VGVDVNHITLAFFISLHTGRLLQPDQVRFAFCKTIERLRQTAERLAALKKGPGLPGGTFNVYLADVTRQDEALFQRLSELLAEHAPRGIVSVYLFGSQADARSHRESDVDIGVLLRWDLYPTERDRFRERLDAAGWLAAGLGGRHVDVVLLNDAPPGLGRHIVTTGRRVYCADAEADHAFARDVQLRAADLEPFLRRARKVKLNAIAR